MSINVLTQSQNLSHIYEHNTIHKSDPMNTSAPVEEGWQKSVTDIKKDARTDTRMEDGELISICQPTYTDDTKVDVTFRIKMFPFPLISGATTGAILTLYDP